MGTHIESGFSAFPPIPGGPLGSPVRADTSSSSYRATVGFDFSFVVNLARHNPQSCLWTFKSGAPATSLYPFIAPEFSSFPPYGTDQAIMRGLQTVGVIPQVMGFDEVYARGAGANFRASLLMAIGVLKDIGTLHALIEDEEQRRTTGRWIHTQNHSELVPGNYGTSLRRKIREMVRVKDNPMDTMGKLHLPMTPASIEILEEMVNQLTELIPRGERPKMFLFGPGNSSTEPLYLFYLAERLQEMGWPPAIIQAYDYIFNKNHGNLLAYYQRLNRRAPHQIQAFNEDFEGLHESAHLILCLHPDLPFPNAFSHNLVPGGYVLLQKSRELLAEPDMAASYEKTIQMLFTICRRQEERVFYTPYAIRKPTNESFCWVLRNKIR